MDNENTRTLKGTYTFAARHALNDIDIINVFVFKGSYTYWYGDTFDKIIVLPKDTMICSGQSEPSGLEG